jgi:hypothetical protein
VAIGPHVYDSWNNIKQKKIEKIMQCWSIKSPPLWCGGGFSLKIRCYYAFITKQMKKTHFLNGISFKKI